MTTHLTIKEAQHRKYLVFVHVQRSSHALGSGKLITIAQHHYGLHLPNFLQLTLYDGEHQIGVMSSRIFFYRTSCICLDPPIMPISH